MWGERGRGKRSESDKIQREEKDEIILQEDTLRSQEAECGEAAQNERPVRETHNFVNRSRSSPVQLLGYNELNDSRSYIYK